MDEQSEGQASRRRHGVQSWEIPAVVHAPRQRCGLQFRQAITYLNRRFFIAFLVWHRSVRSRIGLSDVCKPVDVLTDLR